MFWKQLSLETILLRVTEMAPGYGPHLVEGGQCLSFCLPHWTLSPPLTASHAVPDEHPEGFGSGFYPPKTLQPTNKLREAYGIGHWPWKVHMRLAAGVPQSVGRPWLSLALWSWMETTIAEAQEVSYNSECLGCCLCPALDEARAVLSVQSLVCVSICTCLHLVIPSLTS